MAVRVPPRRRCSTPTSPRLADRGCTVLFNSGSPVGDVVLQLGLPRSRPRGTEARYDKRHLVPFGEYVPFRGVFGWMDKLARNAGEFRPADRRSSSPGAARRSAWRSATRWSSPPRSRTLVRAGARRSWSRSPTTPGTATPPPPGSTSGPPASAPPRTAGRCCARRSPASPPTCAPDGSVREQIGVYQRGGHPRPGARARRS